MCVETPNKAQLMPPDLRATVELMDVEHLAQEMHCSPRHIRRLVDAGKMPPPLRLGRLLRWHRQTLVQWIASGCPVVGRKGGVR